MKWNFLKFVVLSILFFPFSHLFAAVQNYTLDPMHTYVLWHISHFGFSNPSGKWMATGNLILDEEKPENSKVNVTVNTAAFITGIPELDKHLASPLFFDVARFPTTTFISDKVDVTGKDTANVHGILTLHGVAKPITLNVTLNKIGENPITHKPAVGFSATTKIQRSNFGMNSYLPGIGDDVTLNIEVEAYK